MDPARLGTAARMQIGGQQIRMTTAARQGIAAWKVVNYTGVGQNTQVKVVERPITNHGVRDAGVKTAATGPGRQIYDRNYYNNLLKQKKAEIMNEINKMKTEVEEINKDNGTYLTLEEKV